MSAILPFIKFDNHKTLARFFMPHQLAWILAEDKFHAQKKQVFALAEKSVRTSHSHRNPNYVNPTHFKSGSFPLTAASSFLSVAVIGTSLKFKSAIPSLFSPFPNCSFQPANWNLSLLAKTTSTGQIATIQSP